MKFYSQITLLLLIFWGSTTLATPVYKSVDKDGKIYYSDQPEEGSEEIILPPAQTYTPAPLPPPVVPESTQSAEQGVSQYQVDIIAPENESVFTTEVQTISIKLSIKPELHEDDHILLRVNGEAYGTFQTSPNFTLGRLDRGRYDIQAFVYSKTNTDKPKGQSEILTIHQIREMLRQAPP